MKLIPYSRYSSRAGLRLPGGRFRRWSVALTGWSALATAAPAELRLSELMAVPNSRALARDARERLRPGSGLHWTDLGYSMPGWRQGAAPLGFGGAAGLGTNVATLMRNRTPGLYLRRSFTASAAERQNLGRLELRVSFNDGFVAYLNGREAGRANAGPAGHFIHHDQPAYNFAAAASDNRYQPGSQPGVGGAQPVVMALGPPAEWLRDGENVLAIHLLNREPDIAARIDAGLAIVAGASATFLFREDFSDANGASRVHRVTGGVASDTVVGTVPAGSWLDRAPLPHSDQGWSDLELTHQLDVSGGLDGTGALRVSHEQTGDNQPAAWRGPAVLLGGSLAGGPLTPASLAAMTLSFRFRASAEVAYGLRMEPTPGNAAVSLTGLPPLTPTAGTAAAESPPDTFADSVGGARSLDISATGVASAANAGSVRNAFTLSAGAAMRNFAFRVVEDATPGAGASGSTGHLRCEVTRAAAHPDSFGFALQPFQVRSWTAGALTPAHLRAVVLEFDARAAAGVPLRVWLEPGFPTAGPTQRLDLGTVTGTGDWQRHELHPAVGTNQPAFLTAMNALATTSVRIAFRCETPRPSGSAWQLDNVGFVPWRTYSTTLAVGTNADAFLAALNDQPTRQFFPTWEKTGTALRPQRAVLVIDDMTVSLTEENAGTAQTLVPTSAPAWDYWPGLAEPSGGLVEPADFSQADAESDFEDWIEIENTGSTQVSLAGWSLTVRHDQPRQWSFPANVTVDAGARLLVMASGRDALPGTTWIHAPFTLKSQDGYLALVDPSGVVRDGFDPGYGPQDSFHSFGRNDAGVWGYLREASPGAANTGPWSPAQAEAVRFSLPGGFHTGPVTVSLTTDTPDARLMYTLDGSEPTETTGLLYTTPLTLQPINDKIGHTLRARAWHDGWLASPVNTETYLINQHPNLRKASAVVLTGDPGGTFYRPTGILAIQGGTYASDLWVPQKAADYNVPMNSGRLLDPKAPQRPYERPAHLEFFPVDDRPSFSAEIGLRVSSSPYSRPRLRLTQVAATTPWGSSETEKPSLNVFFRSDYGSSSITYPLIPETPVRRFEEFRLRAGKNDISNPFIRDEFIRRLFTDMGQTGIVGSFNGLWINGTYKGYFNLCERIREPFFQNHYPGSGKWDVNYIGRFENGDDVHFKTILTPRLNANLGTKANYDALANVLDLTNAADYYLLMVQAAMWDWPENNYAMARERAADALWRCYVWDAEGGYGLYGNKLSTWNTFTQDLLAKSDWLSIQFRRLMSSAEWRLLFADRIQRHFFNGGALADARLTERKNATAAEVQPFLVHAGQSPDNSWFTNWLSPTSGRRRILLPRNLPGQAGYSAGHFRDPNSDRSLADTLWPLTLPPVVSLAPGSVPAGSTLALSLAPGVPDDTVMYFTINGGDPRVWGGAPAAGALRYSDPLPLAHSLLTVRARAFNVATAEWSPLTEATYRVGTVPAGPGSLVVSELMYHPPSPTAAERAAGFADPDEFEYLALRNITNAPVELGALQFATGVSFDFAEATRTVVDPGEDVLIGRNRAAMAHRYGDAAAARVIGVYFGGLGNGGEELRLETKADGTAIQAFAYGDLGEWPAAADGEGASLLLRDPRSNPDHALAANWTASAAFAGQPGGTAVLLPYAQWGAWVLGPEAWADPSVADPQADADADGWANILEFMLLGSPLDPARQPSVNWQWTTSPDGARLEVHTRVNPGAGGITLIPEGSPTLAPGSWERGFTAAPDVLQPDGSILRSWAQPVPAGATSWHGRLRVTPSTP